MSVLRDLWEQYKRLESTTHKRSSKALEIEALIHTEQKTMGVSAYDFDKRWIRRDEMAKSTVEGPPDPNTQRPEEGFTVPQTKFTLEEAEKIVGENELAILADCAKLSEARNICLAAICDKLNPADNKNQARRGQIINMAITEFHKRKET